MTVLELKMLLDDSPDNYKVWLSVEDHTEEVSSIETESNHEDYGATGEVTIYA